VGRQESASAFKTGFGDSRVVAYILSLSIEKEPHISFIYDIKG
jgi:hypothetical protein